MSNAPTPRSMEMLQVIELITRSCYCFRFLSFLVWRVVGRDADERPGARRIGRFVGQFQDRNARAARANGFSVRARSAPYAHRDIGNVVQAPGKSSGRIGVSDAAVVPGRSAPE